MRSRRTAAGSREARYRPSSWVGAERTAQAEAAVKVAREVGAQGIAHGSTRAGNDQIRFDVALRALAPDLELLAPIRSKGVAREEAARALEKAGVPVPAKTTRYSVNAGLVGTTVGGGDTHDAWATIPEEAFEEAGSRLDPAAREREVVIGFDRPFVIIGERINPTGRKKLAEEMRDGNFDTVVADALAQVEAGAQMLDVNAGIPLADADRWPWLDRLNRLLRERQSAGEHVILGCSALRQVYRERLAQGLVDVRWVHLKGSFDLIASRLQARKHRYMPPSLLRSQFETLEEPTDALAVDITDPPDALARRIAEALR